MNANRNGTMKVSTMIKRSLMGALGLSILAACSAAPDAQGENVGTAKEALCNLDDGCTPAPRPTTTYTPPSRVGATCPGINAGCYLVVTTWDPASTFEVSLQNAGCTLLTREYTTAQDTKAAVCKGSATLNSIVAGAPGATQSATYCDECQGAPNAGYTYVFWNTSPHTPRGCTGCTPAS